MHFTRALKGFAEPSWELEQYETPSSIAAEWVWSMALKGEAVGKIILDAACGSGIIGLGLLLMGARKVYFLDSFKPYEEKRHSTYKPLDLRFYSL